MPLFADELVLQVGGGSLLFVALVHVALVAVVILGNALVVRRALADATRAMTASAESTARAVAGVQTDSRASLHRIADAVHTVQMRQAVVLTKLGVSLAAE